MVNSNMATDKIDTRDESRNTFILTCVPNGGYIKNPKGQWYADPYSFEVTMDQEIGNSLPDTSRIKRPGYRFIGWFKTVAGFYPASGPSQEEITKTTKWKWKGNIIVEAGWEANTCTVTWDGNGGKWGSAQKKTNGTKVGHVVGDLSWFGNVPTYTGKEFVGWFTHPIQGKQIHRYTNVDEARTYYAHWSINQYKATFLYNDGTEKKMVKVQDFGTALVSPELSRPGYTFNGWSPVVPSTMPASDTTYTAQWLSND